MRYYDIASKKTVELVSETEVPWDVEDIEVSKDGVIVISYNVETPQPKAQTRMLDETCIPRC